MNSFVYLEKARTGTPIRFQDGKVKNRLLAGIPTDVLIEIDGYLDLMASEIARKYDVIHSQREALGRTTVVAVEKPLQAVQDKQTGGEVHREAGYGSMQMNTMNQNNTPSVLH